MAAEYDMCIDYDTLCEIEQKLKNISNNLGVSADSMLFALRNCDGFLAGKQFEKASKTTITCTEVSKRTIENINNVLAYINKLKECLETYSGCGYN